MLLHMGWHQEFLKVQSQVQAKVLRMMANPKHI